MKKFITTLQRQKQFKFKSQGESMLPLFHPNDILYFKKITFPRIKTNDLIMVKKIESLFTHRVVYKTNECLITKRDNNLESDGKINPGKIYVDRDGRQETYTYT